jgi:hypothetical protein
MFTFTIVLQIIVAGLIVSSVKYVYVDQLKFHANVTSLLKKSIKISHFLYSDYPPDYCFTLLCYHVKLFEALFLVSDWWLDYTFGIKLMNLKRMWKSSIVN